MTVWKEISPTIEPAWFTPEGWEDTPPDPNINESPVTLSVDKQGHTHRGKGEKGGQFTGASKGDKKKTSRTGTDAPSFKVWFGNSKVVDAEGEPKETHGTPVKVYHGTGGDFNVFDKDRANAANAGTGFYFAEKRELAESFADESWDDDNDDEDDNEPKRGVIIEAYLSIQNPFVLEDRFPVDKAREILEHAKVAIPDSWSGTKTVTGYDVWQTIRRTVSFKYPDGKSIGTDGVNEILQELGYDGLSHMSRDLHGSIARPAKSAEGGPGSSTEGGRCWIAFEPTQVKKTTNTSYDPNNPDMNLSLTQTTSARALWANKVQRECLLEAGDDVEAGLAAAAQILALIPVDVTLSVETNDDTALSIDDEVVDDWDRSLIALSTALEEWSPYLGVRGANKGKQVGWKHVSGRIVYGLDKPGGRGKAQAAPAPGVKTPAPVARAGVAAKPQSVAKPPKAAKPAKVAPPDKQQVLALVQAAMKQRTPDGVKAALNGLMGLKLPEMRAVLAAAGVKGKGRAKSDLAKLVENQVNSQPVAAPASAAKPAPVPTPKPVPTPVPQQPPAPKPKPPDPAFEARKDAVKEAAAQATGKTTTTSPESIQSAHDAAKAKMDDVVNRHLAAANKAIDAYNAYDDTRDATDGEEKNKIRQVMWDTAEEERTLRQEREVAEKEYAAAASALSVSNTNQAMAESAARGSNLSVDRAMTAADEQGVDDTTKVKYRRAFSHIAAQMPDEATRLLNMGLQSGFKFYGHVDDVTREADKISGGDSFANRVRTHGFFNPHDGSLNLDGDSASPPESVTMSQNEAMRGVFAHEMTHSLDYGARAKTGKKYSDDAEWRVTHDAEANGLSDYAGTSESESFAEFGRLVYGSDVDRETVKAQFPLGYAFFKKRGLINW